MENLIVSAALEKGKPEAGTVSGYTFYNYIVCPKGCFQIFWGNLIFLRAVIYVMIIPATYVCKV